MDDDATMPDSGGDANAGEPTRSTEQAGPPDGPRFGFVKGDRIGRYRLIEVLGEGGFGVVWKAEQTEPVRRVVAIKLIKPGMDSKSVVSRFEAERQALAVMDHPNIARVLDGGATENGYPYFVMELVKGTPITNFCDTQRMGINDRLRLFAEVCHAVQHAHMKGVIHRDLKPSNVLVEYDSATGKAHPKVIDFGVAKALNQRLSEATIFTERGQMIGTPEYMSPEQAEMSGLDIDTRSDVYSLGVMLYELLTGFRPFDLKKAALYEIQRIIREVEPSRPSTRLSSLSSPAIGDAEQDSTHDGGGGATGKSAIEHITSARREDTRHLTTLLRRDLDWVVMKALDKDRSRRYDTASDLADELGRFINNEPVLAGPPSASYRLSKFVRRNKGPVAAGLIITTLLVGGIVGTTWGMGWALRENENARTAEAEQRRLATSEAKARQQAEARAEELEWQSYRISIAAADRAIKDREIVSAQKHLEICPKHLRGWEWRYLQAVSDTSLFTFPGQNFVLLPDRESFLVFRRGEIIEREVRTGRQVHVTQVDDWSHDNNKWVKDTGFSADGSRLFGLTSLNRGAVWDTRDGRMLCVIEAPTRFDWPPVFSDDGAIAASMTSISGPDGSARSRSVLVWSTDSGDLIATIHASPPEDWDSSPMKRAGQMFSAAAVSLSADGTIIGIGYTGGIARFWRINELGQSPFREISLPAPEGESGVSSESSTIRRADVIRIRPSGTHAFVGGWEMIGQEFDLATGTASTTLTDRARLIQYAADESAAVFSFNDRLAVVDLAEDKGSAFLSLDRDALLYPFLGDGRLSVDRSMAVASYETGELGLWEPGQNGSRDDWRPTATLRGHTARYPAAEFAADDERLVSVSAGDGTVRIWSTHTVANPLTMSIFGSPDIVVSPDSTMLGWSGFSGYGVASLNSGMTTKAARTGRFDRGGRVAWSADGGSVFVWDGENGSVTGVRTGIRFCDIDLIEGSEFPQFFKLADAALTPDGRTLVTMSNRGLEIWDARTGTRHPWVRSGPVSPETWTGHQRHIVMSPRGDTFVTYHDGNFAHAVVWSLIERKSRFKLLSETHTSTTVLAAFSPDGSRILTLGRGGLFVWDAGSGEEIWHDEAVAGNAPTGHFSPDGSLVIAKRNMMVLGLWDARTGALIREFSSIKEEIDGSCFSPDGTRLVFTDGDVLRVHDVVTGDGLLFLDRGTNSYAINESVWFSPDGNRLIARDRGGFQIWDAIPMSERIGKIEAERASGSVQLFPSPPRESVP